LPVDSLGLGRISLALSCPACPAGAGQSQFWNWEVLAVLLAVPQPVLADYGTALLIEIARGWVGG